MTIANKLTLHGQLEKSTVKHWKFFSQDLKFDRKGMGTNDHEDLSQKTKNQLKVPIITATAILSFKPKKKKN